MQKPTHLHGLRIIELIPSMLKKCVSDRRNVPTAFVSSYKTSIYKALYNEQCKTRVLIGVAGIVISGTDARMLKMRKNQISMLLFVVRMNFKHTSMQKIYIYIITNVALVINVRQNGDPLRRANVLKIIYTRLKNVCLETQRRSVGVI